ncbi:MAG: rRNA maturation RNAse YbeY [Candidatus Pacebacteria bacterium]|nr:rRNA maturation RNAse YbeY [Candidatus Paceibacterota bacterium]
MREKELFEELKDIVLGKNYDLSVAFLLPAEIRKVTKQTKKIDKISNVLSFPLSKNSGEILICRKAAAPYTVPYLFIHGLYHLKGFKHGARMESAEGKLLKRFSLHAKNSNRH